MEGMRGPSLAYAIGRTPVITIAGLGPGGLSHLTQAVFEELKRARVTFLRTRLHPIVEELESLGFQFLSFDDCYEFAATFEDVYSLIAAEVMKRAEDGDVLYAVPGHPLVGERSVELLIERARDRGVPLRILSGLSFIEPVVEAVGIGFTSGLKVLDALSIEEVQPDPGVPNIVYQLHGRLVASQVKLALLDHYPPEFQIALIHAAGVPNGQKVEWLPLYDLDRRSGFDHLTTLYVPPQPREHERRKD